MLTRRIILAAPLALAACNGMPNQSQIAVVAQDVQIIAAGLGRALTQLGALQVPGLTPAVLDVAQKALAGLQVVSQALASVSTNTDAQPLVAKVSAYVNAFVGALVQVPAIPPQIQVALTAATVLLPIIEASVNLVVPPAKAQPMTPDQARAALK